MHGWSPDGKYIVFCSDRNGKYAYRRIPSGGGPEVRLTDAKGLDDGQYSPLLYLFHLGTERTGWYGVAESGMAKEQNTVNKDDFNNWFPMFRPTGNG